MAESTKQREDKTLNVENALLLLFFKLELLDGYFRPLNSPTTSFGCLHQSALVSDIGPFQYYEPVIGDYELLG